MALKSRLFAFSASSTNEGNSCFITTGSWLLQQFAFQYTFSRLVQYFKLKLKVISKAYDPPYVWLIVCCCLSRPLVIACALLWCHRNCNFYYYLWIYIINNNPSNHRLHLNVSTDLYSLNNACLIYLWLTDTQFVWFM